jgi:competence protein ComEC
MFYWTPVAMVRILGFYVIGIYIAGFTSIEFRPLYLWLTMTCFAAAFLLTRKLKPRSVCGFFGLTFITLTGWLNTGMYDESARPNHLSKLEDPVVATISTVIEPPQKTTSGYRVLIQITKVRTQKGWKKNQSKAYWYFKKSTNLNRGDIILTKGPPQKIKSSPPEAAFDYTLYLKRKNIFFRQYVSPDDIATIGKSRPDLYAHAITLRKWCIGQLSKFVKGKNERAIAIALITGQSDDLDPELNQYYAVNGTLHVLSVSGLHTGLLYTIILFLLKPLGRVKHGKWIISVVTMIVLWCYSLVTGLSPSVLRAVTMFSFVTISKPLGLRSNIWNTLASSAFLLLLFNPWLITGIGFQLSYLALGGIIWLHPLLLRQWEPGSWIMFSAWNLTCMSVAAQLTTLPVSLLNFNQFPVWFIPANLLVIPLSSIALMAGLAFIPLSTLPFIAEVSGKILEMLIGLMNLITTFIGTLPAASINHIFLLPSQAALLLLLIISTGLYLEKRKNIFLTGSVIAAAFFGFLDYAWKEKELSNRQISFDIRRTGSSAEIKSGGHRIRIETARNLRPATLPESARHPWVLSHKNYQVHNACITVQIDTLNSLTIINSKHSAPPLQNNILMLGPEARLNSIGNIKPQLIIQSNPRSIKNELKKKLDAENYSILKPDTAIIIDLTQKESPVD